MTGPRRSRAPELWVLALGLGAAVALAWAALLPAQDPETAARAELAALAGEVEDAVRGEWARVLRELPERVADHGPALRWGDGVPAAAEPVELDLATAPVAWRALLLDADDARDAARGLELARLAQERSESDAQRAEALLRVAQNAALASDADGARTAWTAAHDQVPGSASRGGISLRLATFLAAAPALESIERARAAADLALEWSRGELALPLSAEPGALDERVALLAERLARAADPSGAGPEASVQRLLDRALERLRATSLERAPGPLPERPEGSAWRIERRGDALLAWSAADGNACTGFLLNGAALGDALTAAAGPLLPPDFQLDLAGDGPGDALRPRVELVPGALGFTLRHRDARAWIAAGSTRARWMRWGLGALALLCGVAGAVTARALGRERHLAEVRSAFVAGVSHELRTPVASILLLAENLEQGRVADEAGRARYHGLIRREALRLRRLVDGVLDFSRLERGKGIDLAREDVDVPAWMESVREEALEWARQHGMELALEVGELPASARIDREALRRALWNLLENAHRHSGSKQAVLRARGEERVLVLEVEDRGRGVPASQRAAIFEPFARFADPGTAGAGLGLALVREIARAHGGTIAVAEGAGGSGARFTLRVPIETEESP